MKKDMIEVSFYYPRKEDKSFDMDYYINKHVPKVKEWMGDALKGATVSRGLSAGDGTSSPEYVAIGRTYYESVKAMMDAYKKVEDKIAGDMENYTDIKPMVQISKVVM